jgi:hypothetical protein
MKRVRFRLAERVRWVGDDAFGLLGAFRRAAHGEGWTDEEVNQVIIPAAAKGYEEVLRVLAMWTIDPDDQPAPTIDGAGPPTAVRAPRRRRTGKSVRRGRTARRQ